MSFPHTTAILALLVALLAGCDAGDAPTQSAQPASRPVKTFVLEGGQADDKRNFPARIDASRRAELGFRVPGMVKDILVKEGDTITEGAVMARLDPTDLQIVLKDREASYDNAKRNFERGRELIGAGNISRLDYDRMEANFKSAEAAYQRAQQDLAYSELKAPFPGRLAKRHVERFEEVAAKQTIFSLQQIDDLDVKIDLPESLIRSFRIDRDENPDSISGSVPATVAFDGMLGQDFELRVKEVATKADPKTQTFEVTLSMHNPETFVLLPGMTATVTLNLSGIARASSSRWIPATAVAADANLAPYVWLLDPGSMTLLRKSVRTGRMDGNQIEVIEGLSGGDEIVAVGLSHLAENMQVTRMASLEQALPRGSDPH
jgi:RND family efflux transporter MFP subunit